MLDRVKHAEGLDDSPSGASTTYFGYIAITVFVNIVMFLRLHWEGCHACVLFCMQCVNGLSESIYFVYVIRWQSNSLAAEHTLE